jgi:hypothetical protein
LPTESGSHGSTELSAGAGSAEPLAGAGSAEPLAGAGAARPRTEAFFSELIGRDPSGRSWLSALLQATPGGESLGALAEDPGWLDIPLAVPGASGRLACLDFRAPPAREWLLWMVGHPQRLLWPEGMAMTPETERLRRVLFEDDPPGTRLGAQERARELALSTSPNVTAWWRLEEIAELDCVLSTDRLVVVVEGRPLADLTPVTGWYPARTPIVRALEAARRLATDSQRWCSLVLADPVLSEADTDAVAASLGVSAPHLGTEDQALLRSAYLGAITWDAARSAVGLR